VHLAEAGAGAGAADSADAGTRNPSPAALTPGGGSPDHGTHEHAGALTPGEGSPVDHLTEVDGHALAHGVDKDTDALLDAMMDAELEDGGTAGGAHDVWDAFGSVAAPVSGVRAAAQAPTAVGAAPGVKGGGVRQASSDDDPSDCGADACSDDESDGRGVEMF